MTANPKRKLVSLNQAAETVGMHSTTIRRFIATGLLTGYRVGPRALRVDPAELDALCQPIPTAEAA